MLKKKMNELMKLSHAEGPPKFSVIKDSEAANLLGGCAALENCQSYSGTSNGCPNLKNCGTYMET
jgi:hypothetical protein